MEAWAAAGFPSCSRELRSLTSLLISQPAKSEKNAKAFVSQLGISGPFPIGTFLWSGVPGEKPSVVPPLWAHGNGDCPHSDRVTLRLITKGFEPPASWTGLSEHSKQMSVIPSSSS